MLNKIISYFLLVVLLLSTSFCNHSDYLLDAARYEYFERGEKLFEVNSASASTDLDSSCSHAINDLNSVTYLLNGSPIDITRLDIARLDNSNTSFCSISLGNTLTFSVELKVPVTFDVVIPVSLVLDTSSRDSQESLEEQDTSSRDSQKSLEEQDTSSRDSQKSLEEQVHLSTNTLTFTSKNWQEPQPIYLEYVENWELDDDVDFSLQFGEPQSADILYNTEHWSRTQVYLYCNETNTDFIDSCSEVISLSEESKATSIYMRAVDSKRFIEIMTPSLIETELGMTAEYNITYFSCQPILLAREFINDIYGVVADTTNLSIELPATEDDELCSNLSNWGLMEDAEDALAHTLYIPLDNFYITWAEGNLSEVIIQHDILNSDNVSILGTKSIRDLDVYVKIFNNNIPKISIQADWIDTTSSHSIVPLEEGVAKEISLSISTIPLDVVSLHLELGQETSMNKQLNLGLDELLKFSSSKVEIDPTQLTVPVDGSFALETITMNYINNNINTGLVDNVVLSFKVETDDPFYQDIQVTSLTFDLNDDDAPGIKQNSPDIFNSPFIEGSNQSFNVMLTIQPELDVQVSYNVSLDAVLLGSSHNFVDDIVDIVDSSYDYSSTLAPSQLTFTDSNWNIPQTVTITVDDDMVELPDRQYKLASMVTSSHSAYNNISSMITFTITDNDPDSYNILSTTDNISSMITFGCFDSFESVAYNISLPVGLQNNGVSITWSSSNSDVISSLGGVTLPYIKEEVTLTVTLTKNYISVSRSFQFTVEPSEVAFRQGCGSKEDPYILFDVIDLQRVALFPQLHYRLGQDIDATMTETWSTCGNDLFTELTSASQFFETCEGFLPIGLSEHGVFQGSLDGAGYTVSNLYISVTDTFTNHPLGSISKIGLISEMGRGGTIQNLFLDDIEIEVSTNVLRLYVGGLVASSSGGVISECSVNGHISVGNQHMVPDPVNGIYVRFGFNRFEMFIGGLLGYGKDVTVMNSSFNGTLETDNYISVYNSNIANTVGGVVGYATESSIDNVYTNGRVSGSCFNCWGSVGGILGRGVSVNLSRVFSAMTVLSHEASFSYAGGIVGRLEVNSSLENMVYLGSVWAHGGYASAGGLVSWNRGNVNYGYTHSLVKTITDTVTSINRSDVQSGGYAAGGVARNRLGGNVEEVTVVSTLESLQKSTSNLFNGIHIGGISAFNASNIRNVYTFSNIIASDVDSVKIGGLVGLHQFFSNSSAILENAYAVIDIDSFDIEVDSKIGGIVGEYNLDVSNTYYHNLSDHMINASESNASESIIIGINPTTTNIPIITNILEASLDILKSCTPDSSEVMCSNYYSLWDNSSAWDFGSSTEFPLLVWNTSYWESATFIPTYEDTSDWQRTLKMQFTSGEMSKEILSDTLQKVHHDLYIALDDIEVVFSDGDYYTSLTQNFTLDMTDLRSSASSFFRFSLTWESTSDNFLEITDISTDSVQVLVTLPSEAEWVPLYVKLTHVSTDGSEQSAERLFYFYVAPSVEE